MRKPNRGGAVVYQASRQQKNNERDPWQRSHVGARWPLLGRSRDRQAFAPEPKLRTWLLTIQRLQSNRLPRAATLISRRMMCPDRRPATRRTGQSTKTKAVMATLATTTSRAPKEHHHRIRFSNQPLIALMWCIALPSASLENDKKNISLGARFCMPHRHRRLKCGARRSASAARRSGNPHVDA
jgi:hypothetical protein